LPKTHGYVGIGKVIEEVKPIRDVVIEIDGGSKKLIDLPLTAPNMKHDLDNDELCEHVVRVEWLATVPKEKAYWTKGLKANQNSAYKLRSQYTIEKVLKFFDLEEN
jgi:hypothetical protein